MLTPDYLKNVANEAVSLYSKLENAIIKDVVRRLKGTDFEMTESARFQIQIAQEAGKLYDDVLTEVAKYSEVSKNVVKKAFENSAIEALEYDDKIYIKAGLTPLPLKQSENMLRILKNTLDKTNGSLYNLTLTTANVTQQSFIDVCNDAYMKISSGAFDYNTALRNAVKQFSEVVKIEYPTGYKLNIKSAVKRAVMTGVNQTTLKLQEERADEMRL
ncbi:MAG: phage minor capsid protein [Bacilli bacterium]